jgi:DNA-binding transcriptional LysR family regulator
MEMQQVRYFVALSKALNFTRAAEQCNVSQPALTRAIKSLEDEFGGALFHRERNNTHLTELGRMVHPYLSQIYEQVNAAKERAHNVARLSDISLKVGAMCTIGPEMFTGFITQFRSRHPGVELNILDASAGELVGLLRGGEVEVAIYGMPGALEDEFHGVRLFDERFVICVPRSHPFCAREVVRGHDLHAQPYVSRAECEYYDFAKRQLNAMGIYVRQVFQSERDDWVLAMIRSGLGFGFFSEFSVVDPELAALPLVEPEFMRTINLVTVRGRPHSPAVGAFVREAKSFGWKPSVTDRNAGVAA